MNDYATLLIETSTPLGSIGLYDGEWHEEQFVSERNHNCEIFAPLEMITAALEPGDIARIIVGTGPGSYSGTRVGIAVAQGLAIAHDCPLVGLPSFLATPPARQLSRCIALGDARRGDWWWAEIINGQCCGSPLMGSREDLRERIADPQLCAFSLDAIDPDCFGKIIPREIPNAARLWECWCQLNMQEQSRYAAMPVQPVYLKPPHITVAKPGHPLQRKP